MVEVGSYNLSKVAAVSGVTDAAYYRWEGNTTISANGVYWRDETRLCRTDFPVRSRNDFTEINSGEIWSLARLIVQACKLGVRELFCFTDSQNALSAFNGYSNPNFLDATSTLQKAIEYAKIVGMEISCQWKPRSDLKVSQQDSRTKMKSYDDQN